MKIRVGEINESSRKLGWRGGGGKGKWKQQQQSPGGGKQKETRGIERERETERCERSNEERASCPARTAGCKQDACKGFLFWILFGNTIYTRSNCFSFKFIRFQPILKFICKKKKKEEFLRANFFSFQKMFYTINKKKTFVNYHYCGEGSESRKWDESQLLFFVEKRLNNNGFFEQNINVNVIR